MLRTHPPGQPHLLIQSLTPVAVPSSVSYKAILTTQRLTRGQGELLGGDSFQNWLCPATGQAEVPRLHWRVRPLSVRVTLVMSHQAEPIKCSQSCLRVSVGSVAHSTHWQRDPCTAEHNFGLLSSLVSALPTCSQMASECPAPEGSTQHFPQHLAPGAGGHCPWLPRARSLMPETAPEKPASRN